MGKTAKMRVLEEIAYEAVCHVGHMNSSAREREAIDWIERAFELAAEGKTAKQILASYNAPATAPMTKGE